MTERTSTPKEIPQFSLPQVLLMYAWPIAWFMFLIYAVGPMFVSSDGTFPLWAENLIGLLGNGAEIIVAIIILRREGYRLTFKSLRVRMNLRFPDKLWKWGAQPVDVMQDLVALSDIAIGNEEDAAKVFGIHAPDTDVTSGQLDAGKYRHVCEQLAERFPDLDTIAITLRGSLSASHNTWSSVLWHSGDLFFGPTYDITHIVDRVGGGDSFVAGLIYGLNTYSGDHQRALDFAVAASALKHTIFGDFNLVSVTEVEKILAGDTSGRVSR